MNRRSFLKQSAIALATSPTLTLPKMERRMGISLASYAIRWKSDISSKQYPPFQDAIGLLNHCKELGAGGLQTGIRNWSTAFTRKVRTLREKLDLYLEGQVLLPKDENDIERFESEVKNAKEAGATILRTVCLLGRRYETFKSLEAFKKFKKDSIKSLEWAEPIMAKHKVKLAIENHKDWRIPELLRILKHLDSEWMGITLDTGNNLSLLEDPLKVVEAFAPYTFTLHFKDMGMEEYEDGFLLAEVPLGQGVLDLPRIVRICRNYNPDVTFNLEMITRDPLKIPCLKDQYWETFEELPGQELAHVLKTIRSKPSNKSLPMVSIQSPEERLEFEEYNVRESFEYARGILGFK